MNSIETSLVDLYYKRRVEMIQKFYQVKGALPADAPSYIKRDADNMLYNALIEHKYCYVLNYRQIGKSSLKNSCAKRLEDIGYRTVHIDLSDIGSRDIEIEQWYFSFIFTIVKQLNLSEITLVNYWLNRDLTIVNRIKWIMDELILKECPDEITIFIDEIDYILSINKFNTDDFFALIRSFYNKRGEDKRYNRLTFVLLGVASPNDLMQDSSRTPFNIAENIKMSQLKLEQSYRLIDGLHNQTVDKKEILKRVFQCTSGTSYLTQKILEDIAKYPIASLNDIDSIVDRLFIQEGFNEINLSNVQERIIKNKTHNVKMLYTIKRIQNGEKIEDDSRRHTYIYLKLSGLIKEEDGLLVYSNQIYQKIFNDSWLDKMLDKLDRPIAKFYQKWVENRKSKRYLLKKETLQEVTKWAHNRSDLLAEEYNYLSISQQEESKNFRIKLEKEAKELREKFLEEQEKYNSRLIEDKKRLLEEQKKHNRLLEEEKKINDKLLEEQKRHNKLLEEEKKNNDKLLEEKKKLLEEQKKFNRRIIRLRQIFAIILSFAVTGIIYAVIYSVDKKTENTEIKLENTKIKLENAKIKLENELKTKKLEKEKMTKEIKEKQQDLEEKKKMNDFYRKVLKGDTIEYYQWKINTYKELDDNQTNYKIAEAYTKIGDIYRKKNSSTEAKKNYLKAINIYKESKKYQKELAYIYYKMDNIAEALKIYEKNPRKYRIQRAKIYYKMTDIFISKEKKEQAEEFYKKGFEIYKDLLQTNTYNQIYILADSLVKKAKISYLKKNIKEAKELYYKALDIYKKLDSKFYKDEIENIEDKVKDSKVEIKHGEGWVYIGIFSKGKWIKRHWWLEKSNTIALKNGMAIAVSGVKLRKRPLPSSKEIGGISQGSIVTIKDIKKYQKKEGTHIWAYIKY